jgi:ABC-type uncharacterized transport system, periplasmic component
MMVIAIVAVMVVAAAGVAIYYSNDDGNDDGPTVNMGFYAVDVKCKEFLDTVLIPEAKNLGINVTYESYGPAAANTVKQEIDNGVTENGKFDLIWGDLSPIAILVPNGEYRYMYDQDWVSELSNSKYLTDGAEDMAFAGIEGYKAGTAAEFSNGQTMLIYNTDFNAYTVKIGTNVIDIPYNCVVFINDGTVTGFLKVVPAGTGSTYAGVAQQISASGITSTAGLESALDSATAYDIDTVRSVVKAANQGSVKGHLLYGLPSNFTELLDWSKIYEGQFTYPDPANTAATFHTNLLMQAMIFELEWNTAKNDWQVAADKDANITKVNKVISDRAISSEADFKTHFGYIFKYLEDLDPYTNKTIGYLDNDQISGINGKVVGNTAADKDFSDATVMIAMTTVASLDMRTDQYNYPLGTFSLDTSVKSQYYLTIPKNSSNKEAAMSIANLLLDPQIQAKWFEMTGNGYNIDTTMTADGDTETIYETYFGFTSSWELYLPQDRLIDVTVNGVVTGLAAYMIAAWTSEIGS